MKTVRRKEFFKAVVARISVKGREQTLGTVCGGVKLLNLFCEITSQLSCPRLEQKLLDSQARNAKSVGVCIGQHCSISIVEECDNVSKVGSISNGTFQTLVGRCSHSDIPFNCCLLETSAYLAIQQQSEYCTSYQQLRSRAFVNDIIIILASTWYQYQPVVVQYSQHRCRVLVVVSSTCLLFLLLE